MRSRIEINDGDMQYIHGDSEELQALILEVLLDIRELLMVRVNE